MIGQCDHHAYSRHGHHAAAGRILLGKLADAAFQPSEFLSEGQSRPDHRFGCRLQHEIAHCHFTDAAFAAPAQRKPYWIDLRAPSTA